MNSNRREFVAIFGLGETVWIVPGIRSRGTRMTV
jgi:hypothetical protein